MQMAMQLIDGRMDSSQYEDSCRQLLGQDAVLLYSCSNAYPNSPACENSTTSYALAIMPAVLASSACV